VADCIHIKLFHAIKTGVLLAGSVQTAIKPWQSETWLTAWSTKAAEHNTFSLITCSWQHETAIIDSHMRSRKVPLTAISLSDAVVAILNYSYWQLPTGCCQACPHCKICARPRAQLIYALDDKDVSPADGQRSSIRG